MCSRTKSLFPIVPLFLVSAACGAPPQYNAPIWMHQFGTPDGDAASGVASLGSDGMIVCGSTSGSLGGASEGGHDLFLARFDANGEQVWVRQYGSRTHDYASSIANDGFGGVLVAGETEGKLGEKLFGYHDAFVARFDGSGNEIWTVQLGTTAWDVAHAVASDGNGGAMVAGVTDAEIGGVSAGNADAFLAHYDRDGEELWIRQFGTSGVDSALAAVSDAAAGAFVAGVTTGAFTGTNAGAHDVFLVRFSGEGEQLWARQFGAAGTDQVFDLAPDGSGGVFVAGSTRGNLGGANAGRSDAFIAHYDAMGNQIWIEQFGSVGFDAATAITYDGHGGALVSGITYADLGGAYAGGGDAFLAHFDREGRQISIRQFGSAERDEPLGMISDRETMVSVVGFTTGDLSGSNAGGTDIFVASFASEPCFADCDRSTGEGVMDVFDFLCFQESFISGESYACDCDTSTDLRVCDVFDFLCFQSAFVGGCSQ